MRFVVISLNTVRIPVVSAMFRLMIMQCGVGDVLQDINLFTVEDVLCRQIPFVHKVIDFRGCLVERFYVSKTPSLEGFYEVHAQECDSLPPEGDRLFLGMNATSNKAVSVAHNLFKKVIPCECCLKFSVTIVNDQQADSCSEGGDGALRCS